MTIPEYNSCVNEYADSLYRFALKTSGDKVIAQDFVQDAFERLWKKAENVEFAKAKAYLFRTIVNLQTDKVRREKLLRTHLSTQKEWIEETPAPFDLKKHLDDAISRLKSIHRQALLLRDYEGYSYLEIAEILNITEDQVKVAIFRARKALKEYLVTIETLV